MRILQYTGVIVLVFLSSCISEKRLDRICEIPEYFITERDTALNVDSVAIWHGSEDRHWLVATAKSGHVLPVYDAITGAYIKSIGKPRVNQAELQRPNGIAIAQDLVFVIERDNKRLQIFKLPDGQSLAVTNGIMQRPYGLAVMQTSPQDFMVYVTDNFNEIIENGPKKVHQYHVHASDSDVTISFVRTFGDQQGSGVLYKVESIEVDPAYDRLIIADEFSGQKNLKVYTLDGVFTGIVFGSGLIAYEPEGIALYPTGAKTGYLIVTDQDRVGNAFYVFDRATLAHIGAFKGNVVRNTDGVAVTAKAFGPFMAGAFYAVHDDGNICAYDWHRIAQTCGLQGAR